MIQNERQYKVTKQQMANLKGAMRTMSNVKSKVPVKVHAAMIAGIKSQIQELQREIQDYENLPQKTALQLSGVESLPELLIKARIARGYSQKDLAELLTLKPQQIQKYEATRYNSASLSRIVDVMKALKVDIQATIPLKPRNRSTAAWRKNGL